MQSRLTSRCYKRKNKSCGSKHTWPFDLNTQFPAARSLCMHFKVRHLLDTHAFGLQATADGPTGVRVTRCEKGKRIIFHVTKSQEIRSRRR